MRVRFRIEGRALFQYAFQVVHGVCMACDGAGTAGCVDVGTKGHNITSVRCVSADDESALPVLAIKMFGTNTFDALPGAEAEVYRSPR